MENKVTSSELAALLALATGKQKDLCEAFLKRLTLIIGEELEKGENVRIKGFGSFKLLEVDARRSVNVSTGEEYEIPAHRRIVFVPARELATAVNSPFEAFEAMEISDETPASILEGDMPEESSKSENFEESGFSKGPEESEKSEIFTLSDNADNSDDADNSDNSDDSEISDSYELSVSPSRFRFAKGFLVGFLVALAVVSCIVVIGYYSGMFHKENFMHQNPQRPAAEDKVSETKPELPYTIQVSDSLRNGTESSVDASVEEVPTQPSDSGNEKKDETKPVYDTVSTTRYLTTIAKEHYGNFNLWPIIYEENKAILGHPDRIKPGTKVVVPPLSKYGIDPTNEAQIKDIKRKGVEIYARFKK